MAAGLETATGAADRPKVLVVDDTPTNRRLLRAILQPRDCEILEAADGGEALRIAHETPLDLVLLDVMMPVKDGYQVCAELKADPRTERIPVIFLSARTQAQDKIRGLELGAVDYITKPYDSAEVLARVETHLRLGSLRQSIVEANHELRHRQQRIDADLRAAAVIQRSLIPSREVCTRFPEVDIAWRFLPCNSIGGDVMNVVRLDEHRLGLYVLDVSGHGVPAAMVTVSVSQQLYPQAGILKEITDASRSYRVAGPVEVLEHLDREFPLERFDKYFTMFYSVLDLRDGTLASARAAHPPAFLVRGTGEIESILPMGTIVGLGGMLSFEGDTRRLEPGDRLFLYTDGAVECPGPAGERFGTERLKEILARSTDVGADELCARVQQALDRFSAGLPAADDVTFLAVDYRGRDRTVG